MISSVAGNLCNKWPKWLVAQNSSYSDYFNVISGLYRTAEPRRPCDITILCLGVFSLISQWPWVAHKLVISVMDLVNLGYWGYLFALGLIIRLYPKWVKFGEHLSWVHVFMIV